MVQNKTNPYWFDIVLDKLYKCNPVNVSIVEDFSEISFEDEDGLIDQAEDTMTILNKYIESMEIKGNKKMLQALLRDLYGEALTMDLEK